MSENLPTCDNCGHVEHGGSMCRVKHPHVCFCRGPLCNRTACRQPGATWWNATMNAWYCQPCAFAINEHTPGLCVRV